MTKVKFLVILWKCKQINCPYLHYPNRGNDQYRRYDNNDRDRRYDNNDRSRRYENNDRDRRYENNDRDRRYENNDRDRRYENNDRNRIYDNFERDRRFDNNDRGRCYDQNNNYRNNDRSRSRERTINHNNYESHLNHQKEFQYANKELPQNNKLIENLLELQKIQLLNQLNSNGNSQNHQFIPAPTSALELEPPPPPPLPTPVRMQQQNQQNTNMFKPVDMTQITRNMQTSSQNHSELLLRKINSVLIFAGVSRKFEQLDKAPFLCTNNLRCIFVNDGLDKFKYIPDNTWCCTRRIIGECDGYNKTYGRKPCKACSSANGLNAMCCGLF